MAEPGSTRPEGEGNSPGWHGWLVDVVVGGLIGGVVALIVAFNVAIYAGIEEGYEASLGDVFEQSTILGVLIALILVLGPVSGVLAARRLRGQRRSSTSR
jgi:hypothetical protein